MTNHIVASLHIRTFSSFPVPNLETPVATFVRHHADGNRSEVREITVLGTWTVFFFSRAFRYQPQDEKPKITAVRLRIVAAVGGRAVLAARLVSSHPTNDRLSIRWIHNGRHVTGARERATIINTSTELRLEVENVTVEDEGDYSVRVGNEAGHGKADFKLLVSGRRFDCACQHL